MSVLNAPHFVLAPPIVGPPRTKCWTVDEFHYLRRLPEYEGRRMILVDGAIIDMPNANHPHDQGIGLGEDPLRNAFGNGFWVRVQLSLIFNQYTDLIPDFSVIPGSARTVTQQPTTALLVTEVSDTSLDYDTGDKANLYAANGIADYWVADLNGRQLIVFRDPIADPIVTHGSRYQTRLELDTSASVSPLAAPNSMIRVADLLP